MTYTLRAQRVNLMPETVHGTIEGDGYVAIEAADTSNRTADGETHWEELPGYGETHSVHALKPTHSPG